MDERLARIPFGRDPWPDLWLVPIRHHSPTCARRLTALFRRVRPDSVLIEGPADATPLIPHLAAKDAKPPLALYCFYTPPGPPDAKPLRYRCFYPFAEFSPEWVALREGARRGAAVRFIDLPYAERVGLGAHGAELGGAEQSLAADRLLQESWAAGRLLAHSGCRDFNEWWDRHFEATPPAEAEGFFQDLLRWCLILRPEGDPGDPETAAREAAMAAAVRAARAEGGRCLVVTGGYHSEGIARLLAHSDEPPAPAGPAAGERGVHLVPYSLARLDSANGYAAGMVDIGYFQELWRQRRSPAPHGEAIRIAAVRVGRRLRARGEPVTLPDALEAVLLAHRLGALRGCPPGRVELFDALEGAFGKAHSEDPARWCAMLHALAAEDRRGRTPRGYPLAPLVEDFRLRAARFQLPAGAGLERVRRLDLYRSRRHRELSRFLHQLRFLGIPYAEREAGPDFAAGSGLGRVQEVWRLRWRPETEASLTERSPYGGQVREAALALLGERLDGGEQDPPGLLLAALQMGLHDLVERLLGRIGDWFAQAGDFVALVAGLARVELAYSAQRVLEAQGSPALQGLLAAGFGYACRRLSWLGAMAPERDAACAAALGQLDGLVRVDAAWCDPAAFAAALEGLYQRAPAPILAGRAAGILCARGHWGLDQGVAALEAALRQGSVDPEYLGAFLAGLLPAARTFVLHDPPLIAAMSRVLLAWDEGQLLLALPHLRLAFTTLRPREIAELGGLLAELLTGGGAAGPRPWTEADRSAARSLYQETRAALAAFGFIPDSAGDGA